LANTFQQFDIFMGDQHLLRELADVVGAGPM